MPTRQRVLPALNGRLAALALAALTACTAPIAPVQMPQPRPPAPVEPAPLPAASPSAKSAAVAAYLARVQADLLAQGLLRTDGGGADAPFTDRMLADNFARIAFYEELNDFRTGFVGTGAKSTLHRWQQPIRVALNFGASVSPERRATDQARVASYLARLSTLTGLPIRLSDTSPNFHIYFVNEDERAGIVPTIAAKSHDFSNANAADLINLPQSTYCLVYTQSQGNSDIYTQAFAVIRAETPDLLRLSCIHEEIAQALGLANDSPQARPSIFNDNQEYALLTRQDEAMLRLLYNPALRPGLTEEEARPLIISLASTLLGGES